MHATEPSNAYTTRHGNIGSGGPRGGGRCAAVFTKLTAASSEDEERWGEGTLVSFVRGRRKSPAGWCDARAARFYVGGCCCYAPMWCGERQTITLSMPKRARDEVEARGSDIRGIGRDRAEERRARRVTVDKHVPAQRADLTGGEEPGEGHVLPGAGEGPAALGVFFTGAGA